MVARVKSLLGEEGYNQALAPLEQASGLPNPAYWSRDWFELEQERIFRRAWVFAGARAELPEPGDVKPLDVGGVPIMLVHGPDGQIRAFQNVCRHRGMRLVARDVRKNGGQILSGRRCIDWLCHPLLACASVAIALS